MRNLLFVDVESTGLDPSYHEMIEVAALLTTPDASKILESYEAKIRPNFIARAHPRALEVNGYSEEEWRPEKCVQPGVVAVKLARMSKDVHLVGQNVSFDESFLTAFLVANLQEPKWNYHKVDLVALCWPLFASGLIEKTNLQNVAKFLGLNLEEQKHRAMADTQMAYAVYKSLMAYLTAKIA